jgi:hypothetical protein
MTIHYEAGIQWRDWANTWDLMTGRGINRGIKRAYGVVASRYRAGDQIVLLGYSRGAFAVRSLAGVIDKVGLVRDDCATEPVIEQAYGQYRAGAKSNATRAFCALYCHVAVQVRQSRFGTPSRRWASGCPLSGAGGKHSMHFIATRLAPIYATGFMPSQ